MVAKLDFDFAEANLAEHIDLGVAADKDPVPPAVGADPGLLPVDTFAGVLGPRMVLEKQLGWAMGPQFDKTVLGHLFELRAVDKARFAAAAKADIVAAVVVVVEVSVVELEKRTVAAAVEAAVVAEANAAAVVVVAVGDAIVAAVAVVVAGGDAVETVVVAAFEVVIANMAAAEAAMEHSAAVADLVVVGFPS